MVFRIVNKKTGWDGTIISSRPQGNFSISSSSSVSRVDLDRCPLRWRWKTGTAQGLQLVLQLLQLLQGMKSTSLHRILPTCSDCSCSRLRVGWFLGGTRLTVGNSPRHLNESINKHIEDYRIHPYPSSNQGSSCEDSVHRSLSIHILQMVQATILRWLPYFQSTVILPHQQKKYWRYWTRRHWCMRCSPESRRIPPTPSHSYRIRWLRYLRSIERSDSFRESESFIDESSDVILLIEMESWIYRIIPSNHFVLSLNRCRSAHNLYRFFAVVSATSLGIWRAQRSISR